MSRELLNTLFVMTPDAYVRLDHESLKVEVNGEKRMQVPLHHLGSIMLFGNTMISPQAMQRCAADGRTINFMDFAGRFKARVEGPESGNVLLRLAQYDAYKDTAKSLEIARNIVAGKLRNSYQILCRAARESDEEETKKQIQKNADQIGRLLINLGNQSDIDSVRGFEGQGAALYFDCFGKMILASPEEFSFNTRSRRPPRDRVNALLSFIYSLLSSDCATACEGVGLDPQIGYLHTVRPGRPALALDLMEEFRSAIADRLVISLINRKQIKAEHFETHTEAGESVLLTEAGRKTVLESYQKRKQEEIIYPFLKEKTSIGLLPHLQARILARHLRGDLENYIPFLI